MARRRKAKVTSLQLAFRGVKETELKREVASLKRRNDILTELNKSKEEFIAITSHQLRTPATGVKQYLGLLLEGYSDALTENQMTLVQKAYDNNERQLEIVDDILRVAQLDLEKIRLHLSNQNINKIISASIRLMQSKFDHLQQNVTFKPTNDPIETLVDKRQFQMVIENLLDNASNYTPDKGRIDIETSQSNGLTIKTRA
jgi:signal transduction histidine kinase